jgi:hypothetical protein
MRTRPDKVYFPNAVPGQRLDAHTRKTLVVVSSEKLIIKIVALVDLKKRLTLHAMTPTLVKVAGFSDYAPP